MEKKTTMHLAIQKGDIGGYVLLPGSPERAEKLASFLDNVREVAYFREYHTFTGSLCGVPVSVTSTGMGGPSVAIAVEELRECGAHTMIRVGTCESLKDDICVGQVVLPNGAVRMEGVGSQYALLEYPAVPDFELLSLLEQSAAAENIPYTVGVDVTKAYFYGQYSENPRMKEKWDSYRSGNALCADMGCAPFFLAASTLKIRAAAVLGVAFNNNAYNDDMAAWPAICEEVSCRTAITALKKLIESDGANR